MKNTFKHLIQLFIIVTIAFFASCSEEEEVVPTFDPPTINVSTTIASTGADFTSGSSITATDAIVFSDFTVETPGGFNVFRSKSGVDPAIEQSRTDLGVDAGTTTVTISGFQVTLPEAEVGNTINFIFEAVDDLNQVTEITYAVIVAEKPSPNARKVSTRMLAAPAGDNSSKTFYSISQDQLYSRNDVENTADPISSTIDLGYYFKNSTGASIVAPAEYPTDVYDLLAAGWGKRKETKLQLSGLAPSEFEALTSIKDVEDAIANVTFDDVNNVSQLSLGSVIAFETADDTPIKGFIIVKAINGTFNIGDGIDIELILNKEDEIAESFDNILIN